MTRTRLETWAAKECDAELIVYRPMATYFLSSYTNLGMPVL